MMDGWQPHVPSAVMAVIPQIERTTIYLDVDQRRRLAPAASLAFPECIQRGETMLDCGDLALPRITTLMSRYSALPLGFADAAVVACAERNGGTVLTFDRDGL